MKIRIRDVFESQITGEWGNECTEGEAGVKILRTTNFTSEGVIDYRDIVERSVNEQKIKEKRLRKWDIILEKSGGTEKTPVGRVVYCDESIENDIYLCNNFTQAMRVNPKVAVPKYIFYCMWYLHFLGKTDLLQSKTTGIRNLQIKAYLNEEIPFPSMKEQEQVAVILDKVNSLISKYSQLLKGLDQLVKSRFIENCLNKLLMP